MNLTTTHKIALCTIGCLALGSASGLVTVDAIDTWYAALRKPTFNPPNWVFGPAWTILYILMGIAAGLVWSAPVDQAKKRKAMGLFLVQFALNLAWSVIFFGLRLPTLALVEILLLLYTMIACTRVFFTIRRAAGWLMVPYVAWVIFATALNAGIVLLNP